MSPPEVSSGTNENMAHSDQTWRTRRLVFYLLPFLIFPLILFGLALAIVPTHWFAMRSGNAYLANLGYGLTLTNTSCQVLITGDSTALVGVDPAVITKATGLTACNIAEFEGMTLVTGNAVLDHFLAHNPRPLYIVFMYCPEYLTVKKNWEDVSAFEAISYRLEHERTLDTVKVLALHPGETFKWAEQGLRFTAQRLRSRPLPPEAARLRVPTGGQLPMTTEKALTTCNAKPVNILIDRDWMAGLRSRYAVSGTSVLIDATPVPTCEPGLPQMQQTLAGQVDNLPLPTLPIGDYVTGGRLHAGPAGALVISKMIAAQILARTATAEGSH